MKLLIATNLFPSAWDPQRAAFNHQQFERLAALDDVDIEVLTAIDFRQRLRGRRGDPAVSYLRSRHFTFVYPPRVGRSLHAAFWLASVRLQHGRRLRRERFDCLLGSWAYPDGVAVARLARRLRVPYAIKVHGSDINVQAEHALRRRQIAGALQGAGAVIAVSQALADKVVALGVQPARVHVLYNGVDSVQFSPGSRTAARQRLQLSEDIETVLFVGNLKAGKGCLDLLDSFADLAAQRPRMQLFYAGAGPAAGKLAQRAQQYGLASRVHPLGALAHAALPDWFRAADLVCLPSHNEGVPNVLLEAMACGTPVLASAVGGIPEVVPDFAGLLVPARDRLALTAALDAALQRAWDGPRIAAHAQGFRWADNVQRLHGILARIINDAGKGAAA